MKSKLIRSANLRKVNKARLVDHRFLFQAMGMRKRTQMGQVGTIRHEIENDKIIHPLKGNQELGEQGLGYVTS